MAKRNEPKQTSESHWGTREPESQPARATILGLPRQVRECRQRLGPDATPEAVAVELRAAGANVTEEQVRAVWSANEQP